jgi:hypothetical protein
MSTKSIFRSFTLPNGKELRTMREEMRNTALQAVKDKKISPDHSRQKAASNLTGSSLEHRRKLTSK